MAGSAAVASPAGAFRHPVGGAPYYFNYAQYQQQQLYHLQRQYLYTSYQYQYQQQLQRQQQGGRELHQQQAYTALETHFEQPQAESYLHQEQPQRLQVIQLEEVPAPPTRTRSQRASVPSTSYASSSSENEDDDGESSEDEEIEEEEEGGESYCSSEEELDARCLERICDDEVDDDRRGNVYERLKGGLWNESFGARMRRIEKWRDEYAKAVGAQLAPCPCRPKRKCVELDGEQLADSLSRSSKRSRATSSSVHSRSQSHSSCFIESNVHSVTETSDCNRSLRSTQSVRSLRSIHSCSACDTCFPDRGSLREHGLSPRNTNEACRAAVQYDFE